MPTEETCFQNLNGIKGRPKTSLKHLPEQVKILNFLEKKNNQLPKKIKVTRLLTEGISPYSQ